jgi:hypothetical protein
MTIAVAETGDWGSRACSYLKSIRFFMYSTTFA